jgi:hypothetical protein
MTIDTTQATKIATIVGLYVLWLVWLDADDFSGIDSETDTGIQFYINRVYYILTTLSSVGYGDIYPVSRHARLAAGTIMLLMLLGVV